MQDPKDVTNLYRLFITENLRIDIHVFKFRLILNQPKVTNAVAVMYRRISKWQKSEMSVFKAKT